MSLKYSSELKNKRKVWMITLNILKQYTSEFEFGENIFK